jgi:hypothetical protein
MKRTILSVKFEIDVQRKATKPRFGVPRDVCRLFGVDNGDELDLVIRDTSERLLYAGMKPLVSGKEIYGKGLQKMKPGQRIRVDVSLP